MSVRSDLVAELQLLATDATDVATAAAEGEFTSVLEYEAAANGIRARITLLAPQASAEWGARAEPVLRRLRELAARLLDLRAAVADATATLEITVTRTTSLIELAVERYQDFSRWTELAELNRHLEHPGFIRPGTSVVVMHAR